MVKYSPPPTQVFTKLRYNKIIFISNKCEMVSLKFMAISTEFKSSTTSEVVSAKLTQTDTGRERLIQTRLIRSST